MTVDITKRAYQYLENLCQMADTPAPLQKEILSIALKELGIVSEELQVTLGNLQQQNEELVTIRTTLELQVQRYHELFDGAPDAYIVTDASGKIEEVNRAAAKLFKVPQRFLVGKPLIIFVKESDRQAFHTQLMQMQHEQFCEWNVSFCPRDGESFNASLAITTTSNSEGKKCGMRIGIRHINSIESQICSEQQQAPSSNDHRKYVYLKGELIPLKPQIIWQVCHGIVKLSTLSETGEEVLVGLAGSGMPFGADLTSLQTYQATALSQVQLLCVSFSELAESPMLAATVLPQINQRLQQTEALLAIFGQRRVKDRFEQLLQLLKQEIGQPVDQGVRLSVRFTHQELAEACSTTRVTVTRLLGKLQEEGKIAIDAKNHIVIKDQRVLNPLLSQQVYTV